MRGGVHAHEGEKGIDVLWFAAAAFVPAFVLAAVLTPPARRLAQTAELVAPVRPDRAAERPTPYGGGMALAATLALVLGGAWVGGLHLRGDVLAGWLPPHVQDHLAARTPSLLRLGLGALLFFMIGMLDDRYDMPAVAKLLLQFLAAGVVVTGFGIRATAWIGSAWAAEVLSILWIVAVVNAVNLFDHADGLAATASGVALVFLAVGQMTMGEWFVPGVALVAAGALAGFLLHNLPPAKLFLGDAGSLLVGYLLAALAMEARYEFPGETPTRLVVFVPLALLAVPLLDAVVVVTVRAAHRVNPMRGDATRHLGHRMAVAGYRPRSRVAVVALFGGLTGMVSVLLYRATPGLGAAWLAGAVWAAALLEMAVRTAARRREVRA